MVCLCTASAAAPLLNGSKSLQTLTDFSARNDEEQGGEGCAAQPQNTHDGEETDGLWHLSGGTR